ncbi:hypothetical protein AGMMS49938_09370 [Fibrobacterales bacterium]|nr:hypothetical protein AGMMS49938_09370 [Fibrobacterales bacterium]
MKHTLQFGRRTKDDSDDFLNLPEADEEIDEFTELDEEDAEEEETLDEELNFDKPHFRRDLGLDYDEEEDYE